MENDNLLELGVEEKEKEIEELSLKLFNKKSKDIKYLLLTNYVHDQLLQEEIARTGLYQWLNVFNGDVKYPRDITDYSKYDIIQVNMSAQDIHLVSNIRRTIGNDSKIKLVLNNDYTTEMWGVSFEYPDTLSREITCADMLFGTEYFQVTAMEELTHRKVFVIPHPADIKRLKLMPKITKKPIISTLWRRYDNHCYIPSLAVRDFGLTTQLIGYDKNIDRRTFLTTTLYDYVLAGTNFFEFLKQMQESTIVYDPFTYHSYSRTTVDTAALGIPVVGSDRTQSMRVCYPYTCVDPYDVRNSRILIKKLLEDKEFYETVVNTAIERSEFYNHQNSMLRYLRSLDESLKLNQKIVLDIKNIPIKREIVTKTTGDDVLGVISNEKNRKD